MLSCFAVEIVAAKYPKELLDKRYSETVFDIVEIVSAELAAKNSEIFIMPVINKFVDIENLTYGDKKDFVIPENV